jgi:hypothetical protein
MQKNMEYYELSTWTKTHEKAIIDFLRDPNLK